MNYVQEAVKTAAPMPSNLFHLVHAALGLCDEADELSKATPESTHELEELGDLLWFCALASKVLQDEAGLCPFETSSMEPVINHSVSMKNITEAALEIAGLIKKPFAYGGQRPVPYQEIADRVSLIIGTIEAVACLRGLSLMQLQKSNLAKLQGAQGRYKNAEFDAADEVARNYDAEQGAIEQTIKG